MKGLLVVENPADLAFHQLIYFQNEAHKENAGKKTQKSRGNGGELGGVPLQKSTHQKKHPSYGARLLGPNDRSDTSTSLILGLYSLDPLDSPIFYKCNCHAGDDGILGEGVWAILNHRENGGTLGMVPLIINPIYTLYSGYILVISPFKGLLGGLNSLGNHLKGTRIFPRIEYVTSSSFTDEFFFSGSASKTDFAKRFWQTNSVSGFCPTSMPLIVGIHGFHFQPLEAARRCASLLRCWNPMVHYQWHSSRRVWWKYEAGWTCA